MLSRIALPRVATRSFPSIRLSPLSSRRHNSFFTQTEKDSAQLLDAVKARVDELNAAKNAPETSSVAEKIARSKTLKELSPLGDAYERYAAARTGLIDLIPHMSDPDPSIRELFAAERDDLLVELDQSLAALPELLLPRSETAALPAIMSLNAGVGGGEAALFVEEMARLYQRFAERRGWKIGIMSQTEGPNDRGLREITMKFEPPPYGDEDAELYGLLKWERGVHRVQRVPQTESQGRVHTSTITAVVMPIYPDVPDAPLVDPKDVRTDVMRAGGAGGQHVNKTESAVRLTHIPTGITVSMQDSRSQHQNREWAWDVLRARLSEKKHQEEVEAKRASRNSQVKGADRGNKIRTYNFPQDRVTDHRIGLSMTGLRDILDGDRIDLVLNALQQDLDKRRMESILSGEGDFDE